MLDKFDFILHMMRNKIRYVRGDTFGRTQSKENQIYAKHFRTEDHLQRDNPNVMTRTITEKGFSDFVAF